ncbi:MAG: glycine zipper 2TM domain-containing protein [Deltaproteobacteria bacterium]|nr:glycine zipper 2TM domain-containing protein [Deltaproteobacteria bacterium]
MKKFIVFASLMFLCATSEAEAGNAAVGAVTGAAGGAVVGQAIGHNTEGTLVGAVIGGVVGSIVGSGMDGGYYARPSYGGGYVVAPQPVTVYREVYMPPPPVHVVAPYYRPYYRPVEVVVMSGPGRHHHGSSRWSGGHRGDRDHHRHWR